MAPACATKLGQATLARKGSTKPPRSILDNGIPCTLRSESAKGTLYYCKHARTHKGCTRQVHVNFLGQTITKGEHQPACFFKNGLTLPAGVHKLYGDIGKDYTAEMHARVLKIAVETKDSANDIWCQVRTEFIQKGGENFQGMRRQQVEKLVWAHRREVTGVDQVQKVEVEYGGTKRQAFLRHSATFADEKVMQCMMCFALPELLKYLLYPSVSMSDFLT